ncbi:MAG: hypothetical protein V1909_05500 [Candidatus Micrarchaeota archaeon]
MKPLGLYHKLLRSFGLQGWWPARTQFEVAIGAILTQQTNWKSVETAIKELRKRKLLTPNTLVRAKESTIEQCIHPTGFYKQKAKRLKNLACEFPRIKKLSKTLTIPELRAELLELDGVGKETADSILLYAFNLPIFPIDTYTHRITERVYGFEEDYESLRSFYESQLPGDPQTLNEFHALLVELAKRNCWKNTPHCSNCKIRKQCHYEKRSKQKAKQKTKQKQ